MKNNYKFKKRLGLISTIIVLFPLPFIGLLLWFYSRVFIGVWFYVLLPAALLVGFGIYITMLIGFSALIYKLHNPVKEGVFSLRSKEMYSWLLSALVLRMIGLLRGLQLPGVVLKGLYQSIFHTKIGESLVMEGYIEHSLVDIGDNTIIGHHAEIWGHLIENDKIYIKRVKIGNNCTIGAKTMVMPGAVIGDGTIVGAMSLVPKNKKLESNSLYLGVPVRKIKDL